MLLASAAAEALILWWGLIITDFVYVRCGYEFKAFAITTSVNADKFVCMFKI